MLRRKRTGRGQVGAVIIGGDYQGLGIMRSLGRRGIPCFVIDDEHSIGRYSRYCAGYERVSGIEDEETLVRSLLGAATRHNLRGWVLFPTRDETVAALSRNREQLERSYRVPTPRWPVVEVAWDKRRTYAAASDAGVPVPRTWYPRTEEDLEEVPSGMAVAVKPAIKEHFVSVTKVKAWRADTPDELRDLFRRASAIVGPGEVMVQEMVPGNGNTQYAYCVFFKDGQSVGSMTAARKRQHPPEFGKSSTFVETVELPELEQLSTRLLSAIRYEGLAELEYKFDERDGSYKLLDFNARTWGYHSLGPAAGVDFPWMVFSDQLGRDTPAERARTRRHLGAARHRRPHRVAVRADGRDDHPQLHPIASRHRHRSGHGKRRPPPGGRRNRTDSVPLLEAWSIDMLKTAPKTSVDAPVAVIGAGPYGLSVTRHLRKAGVTTHTFGDPMSFWRDHMPSGMLLRSAWTACNIGAARGGLTLDAFAAASERKIPDPVPLDDFIDYGLWYQDPVVPDLDRRVIVNVSQRDGQFVLALDDGDEMVVPRVVVAGGISLFARRPEMYSHLSPDQASHAVDHDDLSQFSGKRVAIVGGGQSALESAALLVEAGATVEVIMRASHINWLRRGKPDDARWVSAILYTDTDVGPPGLNRLVAAPSIFRRLPRSTQTKLAYRAIRPAGAGWLIDRVADARFTFGTPIRSAASLPDGSVELVLGDASRREVDHVLLGTGYQVDVTQYPFLDPGIVARLDTVSGYPLLRQGLESSVPGLHFAGAPAAWSFGPLARFVSGTWYTGEQIARGVARQTEASGDTAGRWHRPNSSPTSPPPSTAVPIPILSRPPTPTSRPRSSRMSTR